MSLRFCFTPFVPTRFAPELRLHRFAARRLQLLPAAEQVIPAPAFRARARLRLFHLALIWINDSRHPIFIRLPGCWPGSQLWNLWTPVTGTAEEESRHIESLTPLLRNGRGEIRTATSPR
jgi:hypothetical protein